VLVLGRLVTRVFTPTSGPNAGTEQRRLEVTVEEIGASLRWAEVAVTRSIGGRAGEPAAGDEPPL
jgi:hypothetical protein